MADCATGTAIAQVDLTKIKPYGDTLNDGMTELAFTLPVPYGDEADEAARQLARKMGLDEPNVVYSKSMTEGSDIKALPIAVICLSPPDRVPAG